MSSLSIPQGLSDVVYSTYLNGDIIDYIDEVRGGLDQLIDHCNVKVRIATDGWRNVCVCVCVCVCS